MNIINSQVFQIIIKIFYSGATAENTIMPEAHNSFECELYITKVRTIRGYRNVCLGCCLGKYLVSDSNVNQQAVWFSIHVISAGEWMTL